VAIPGRKKSMDLASFRRRATTSAIFLLMIAPFCVAQDEPSSTVSEVGWGLFGGYGESGAIVGLNFQLENTLGDGPSLLTLDCANLVLLFRDDHQFVSISALPTIFGVLVSFDSDSKLARALFLALVAPEALSNLGFGFENQRRQRVVLGFDSFVYAPANRNTKEAFGDALLLGMQVRPNLGVTIPLRNRKSAIFLSGGYNYDWSWQGRSGSLGWDVQAGIVLKTGSETW